ncbi:recombinase family protein [Candidatus Uhrbacteria bacterium]|nr:recombinase family protein [Candidatus Uhrbacteria bacterium]
MSSPGAWTLSTETYEVVHRLPLDFRYQARPRRPPPGTACRHRAIRTRTRTTIQEWFEQAGIAAHLGRKIFQQALTLIKDGKACGIVIHMIDRSARNLWNCADLGELIDRGIEVRFADEIVNFVSRGGRGSNTSWRLKIISSSVHRRCGSLIFLLFALPKH